MNLKYLSESIQLEVILKDIFIGIFHFLINYVLKKRQMMSIKASELI